MVLLVAVMVGAVDAGSREIEELSTELSVKFIVTDSTARSPGIAALAFSGVYIILRLI